MGKLAAGLVVLLAACGPRPTPSVTPPPPALQVIVGEFTPPVALRLPGAAEFAPVAVGAELPPAGQVQTGAEAQARLDLADGVHLRLASDTLLSLPASQTTLGDVRVRLEVGKLWASLTGGTLVVETPSGYASLTGSFATFEYHPGDPATVTDDVLIISCLTGACSVLAATVNEQLSNLDQVILTGGTQVVRFTLDPAALTEFRAQNPIVALIEPHPTVTRPASEAAPIAATASEAPTQPTPATATPPPTAALASVTPELVAAITPGGRLGRHVVQTGETIYCIGRAYAVLPDAIAQANNLLPPYAIFANDALDIPSAPWVNAPVGAVCAAQFPSPYLLASLAPTATPNSGPPASATPAENIPTTPQATAQVSDGVWYPPYNLSQSSAATLPALAVDASGRQFALWWDRFDGTRYLVFTPGRGWSPAAAVPSIVGAAPLTAGDLPTAPAGLRLLADNSGLHAFWQDAAGDLLYAQNLTGVWSASRSLVTDPVRWEALVEPNGRLHLAFIRTLPSGVAPAGVFYQQSTTRGSQWSASQVLATSPYFRTLTKGDAHLDLAVTAAGEVFVTWDDPQLFFSFYAHSANSGASFEVLTPQTAGNLTLQSQPRRMRFVPLGDGGLLRLWESGAGCALYQEQRGPGLAGTWSAPLRALERLPGCLALARSFPLAAGGAFLVAGLERGGTNWAFALWDGQRWSEPLAPRISFVNQATNRPATLSCLVAGLAGDFVVALGCDARGDIWGTTSQLSVSNLLPALSMAWSPPVQISDANAEAGLPSVTRDATGRLHALWTEVLPLGSGEPELVYARHDGEGWSAPNRILSAAEAGPANTPLLLAAPGDQLLAVWSGGLSGQVQLTRAFTRDAANQGGWLAPRPLPAPRPVGGWPAMAVDAGGRLRALYAIPFNEERGLYLTESTDGGLTWSAPQLIFDAAAAGWSVLQDTQLVIDAAGTLHVLVARGTLPPAVDPLGVYYLRSTDDGLTWTGPLEVSRPSSKAGYPRLIASRPGELHRLWLESGDGNWQVQHQWSLDAGLTWSQPALVPGLRDMSRNLGLATDGSGALYLVAVEATNQLSAALAYLRWDGQRWVDRETVPLGYGVDAASGASAVLLPSGYLGVLYRVTTSAALGTGVHLVGYTQRPIAAVTIVPLPTLTPLPAASATVTSAPSATVSPSPTLDLNTPVTTPLANGGVWRIIAIMAVMALIVIIAVSRLRHRRRH